MISWPKKRVLFLFSLTSPACEWPAWRAPGSARASWPGGQRGRGGREAACLPHSVSDGASLSQTKDIQSRRNGGVGERSLGNGHERLRGLKMAPGTRVMAARTGLSSMGVACHGVHCYICHHHLKPGAEKEGRGRRHVFEWRELPVLAEALVWAHSRFAELKHGGVVK